MGINCHSNNDCDDMICLMAEGRVDGFCMCPAYATVEASSNSYCREEIDVAFYYCNGWLYYNFFLNSLIEIDFFN
jgi:hypothetical protein